MSPPQRRGSVRYSNRVDARFMRIQLRNGLPDLSLSWILLCILLAMLVLAGGSARADAVGQVFVRATAAIVMIAGLLLGGRPQFAPLKPVLVLLAAILVLPLLQLIPLPPSLWTALPGRSAFEAAAAVTGEAQPWRPWSIVPGATVNAAASLLVPIATLFLIAGIKPKEQLWLPGLLLGLVTIATLAGLLQFSGGGFTNVLVDAKADAVNGTFANRNHFALFLALGCLIAPVWMFPSGQRPSWRAPTGLGLILLFLLTILATGSRAGTGLGIAGLVIGVLLARRSIVRELRRYPRWVIWALVAGVLGAIAIAVLLTIAADRAVSVNRAFALDPGQDMRARGLPTVLAMVREYFPFGSGLGGFDPLFRMHEPFHLLKPTYFNHVHNDFLEILLDAGVPGVLLLIAALGWWLWASVRAWRAGSGSAGVYPKLGSALILLIILASAVDYPARTPMIMAMVAIAAAWLSNRAPETAPPALLADSPRL
jgi:O-antigen ligase